MNEGKLLPPFLIKEWHPTKNGDLKPVEVTKSSKQKVWWRNWHDKCGMWHEWEATIIQRVRSGSGDPVLRGLKVLEGCNDLGTTHPELAEQWHPTKNGDLKPTQITANSGKKIWWGIHHNKCGGWHEWEASPNYINSKSWGESVMPSRKIFSGCNDLATTHPELAEQWHPTKNGDLKPTQIKATYSKKVWWRNWHDEYNMWYEREVTIRNAIKLGLATPVIIGQKVLEGCNDLATTHPELAKQWHPTKNGDLKPTQIKTTYSKKVWWKIKHVYCNSYHDIEKQVSSMTKNNITNVNYLFSGCNDLATTHPELAEQWHPTKNGDLKPTHIKVTYSKKVWWRNWHDKCGMWHEWETSIGNVIKPDFIDSIKRNHKVLEGCNDLVTTHPELAEQWHPAKNGDLKPTQITSGFGKKVWWCNWHEKCGMWHEWETKASHRIRLGSGDPIIVGQKVLEGCNDLATTHPGLAEQWHPTKNGDLKPTLLTSGNNRYKIWWLCPLGHVWAAHSSDRASVNRRGTGCPDCAVSSVSYVETELGNWIEEILQIPIKKTYRGMKGMKELDIFIPSKNIGIEYNGVYWHTEKFNRLKWYHYDKMVECSNQGIQLIQIWEDEWNSNPELVKNMIANKLGVSNQVKVGARSCNIVELSSKDSKVFLEDNHIQGAVGGSIRLGLEFEGELVAVMLFRVRSSGEWEMVRYATDRNVQGGFSKLLNHFKKTQTWESLFSFSDNCVSDGSLYANNGWVFDGNLEPDYKYVVSNVRQHKFGYRLKRFKNDPDLLWEDGLTEKQLAELNGLHRIWDSGKKRWKLTNK